MTLFRTNSFLRGFGAAMTRRVRSGGALIAVLALSAAPLAAQDQAASHSLGTWRNPQNSIHVRMEHCGANVCGVVVWASEKAQTDVRNAGSGELVGATLFRDFRERSPGVWSGRVFVPDIRKTFSGTVRRVDEDHLQGRGCLVGNIGCQSQTWTKVDQ
jgi:uncharacterized protein (DUF2147 family)